MNENVRSALDTFIHTAQNEFDAFAQATDYGAYDKAAQLILDAKGTHNRVHITGIGKPSHIAGYAASLISSTGTPAYFLHLSLIHISEPTRLGMISYAVFCLKK